MPTGHPAEPEVLMIDDNPHDVDPPGTGEDMPGEVDPDLDRLIDQMQTPAQRRGVDALFEMTAKELGEAARLAALDPGSG